MGSDRLATKAKGAAGVGQARRPGKRGILPGCAIVVALLLIVLLDVGKRWEYCTLCGRCRTVRTLQFPRAEWGIEERDDDGYSVALAPLAHADGSAHAWHVCRRRSLLGRAWENANPLAVLGRRRGALRWRHADAVQAACHWDPEFGMTIGQGFIDHSLGADTAEDLVLQARFVFTYSGSDPFDRWYDWYHMSHMGAFGHVLWNELRRAVGLPELTTEEIEALIAKHEPAPE